MDDYDNNKSEQWDWHGEDYCARKDPNLEISEALWNGVPQNQEDISYMFDETTPVKACGDLAYQFSQRDDRTKMAQGSRETSSQVKRRRMLQFDTRPSDPFLCNEDISTQLFKSNERDDLIVEDLPEASNATSGCTMLSDNASTFCYENLDQSSEEWIAECFNDTGMHFSSEELNFPGDANVQIDIPEFCDTPTSYEANVAQQRTTRAPLNIVLKGRKSYIRTPTKLASSVAYPFAFIKPCGVHGDVTLKDINQRIRTPPPSKSKKSEEDPESYPTSAFSGKPVVGKTKIHTEGGKGSITIMRTKG